MDFFKDIPNGDKSFLKGDLDWHVGSVAKGFKGVHVGIVMGR